MIRCVIISIEFLPIVFVAGVEGPTLMRHIIICVVTASTKHSRVKSGIERLNYAEKRGYFPSCMKEAKRGSIPHVYNNTESILIIMPNYECFGRVA